MKKTIFALIAVAAMATACEVEDKYYGKEVVDPAEKLEPAYAENWTDHADQLDEKLIENFMNKARGTFYSTDGDRAGQITEMQADTAPADSATRAATHHIDQGGTQYSVATSTRPSSAASIGSFMDAEIA